MSNTAGKGCFFEAYTAKNKNKTLAKTQEINTEFKEKMTQSCQIISTCSKIILEDEKS